MDKTALSYILLENFIRYLQWSFREKYGYNIILKPLHIKVCQALIKIYMREGKKNLIITMPPRSGKTEIVNTFIEWTITKHIKAKNIITSYSDTLVSNNSQSIRDMINSAPHKELFGIDTKQDSQSKKLWKTNEGGGVYAVSSFGQITGHGAGLKIADEWGGCIVVDDPLKPTDKDSLLKLDKIADWFETTLTNRRNSPDTPIIIIMQRIHTKDLVGRILDNEFGDADEYEVIKIPIIDEENEVSLWEEFYPYDKTIRIKETNPSYYYSQMQQEPIVRGGNMFKTEWIKYVPRSVIDTIEFDKKFITVDTALKDKEKNDYTVYSCFGVKDKKLYMLDMFRGKPRSREREITAKDFYTKNDKYPFRGMYIEQKASGIDLFQRMKDDGFMVFEVERNTDKVFRAENASPYIEIHGIHIVDDLPHVSDLISEYETFPNAPHDDIMDTIMDAVELAYMSEPIDYSALL
jgi:predicted phage terminase large subunit-like protein